MLLQLLDRLDLLTEWKFLEVSVDATTIALTFLCVDSTRDSFGLGVIIPVCLPFVGCECVRGRILVILPPPTPTELAHERQTGNRRWSVFDSNELGERFEPRFAPAGSWHREELRASGPLCQPSRADTKQMPAAGSVQRKEAGRGGKREGEKKKKNRAEETLTFNSEQEKALPLADPHRRLQVFLGR